MKKILSLILVVALVAMSVLTLGSCNGNKTPVGEFVIPEGGYDGSAVTVNFYHSMGSKLTAHVEAAIARFNALYPDITINLVHSSDYDSTKTNIVTELSAGGTDAHIAFCYPDHVALYNDAGATISLDTLINSKIEIERADGTTVPLGFTETELQDFVESYYKEGATADATGTMYSLPFAKSTEVMYYNKTFFEANNIPVPTTWAELEAVCRQIKAMEPTSVPFGYDSESNWFITMAQQYGSPYTSAEGENFVFANEKNYEFVKTIRGWYQEGLVTTKELLGTFTSNKFKDESIYMCVGSTAGGTYQMSTTFEVGIAPVPQVDPSKPQAISQGPSLCIFNKSNPQEVLASWLFVKFLTTDAELQCTYSMNNGYVPVIKSAYNNPTYVAWLQDANGYTSLPALVAQYTIDHAGQTFTSAVFVGSAVAREQVGKLLQACLGGNPKNGETEDQFIQGLFTDSINKCRQ